MDCVLVLLVHLPYCRTHLNDYQTDFKIIIVFLFTIFFFKFVIYFIIYSWNNQIYICIFEDVSNIYILMSKLRFVLVISKVIHEKNCSFLILTYLSFNQINVASKCIVCLKGEHFLIIARRYCVIILPLELQKLSSE